MIKLTVIYPRVPGKRFDMAYYRDKHMALLKSRMGQDCKGYAIFECVSGVSPGSEPAFLASCDLFFESREAFDRVFMAHVQEFRADIPNYTDIEPVRLISELVAQ